MKQELHLTDANLARDASFIEQVKAALSLPADAELELQNIARGAAGGAAVHYAVTLPVVLTGAEFGAANGVSVDERVSATLNFDARGALASSQVSPVDERHLRLVKDNVRKLAAADEIFLASPGEAVDTDALRAKRQPWYVETDAHARKRLKRAYMA
ncbi:MAG: hypothetical protein HY868_20460 [Chloroflexi bacterium]|nr:hypothetical protein [Chloroflexota bacterium]